MKQKIMIMMPRVGQPLSCLFNAYPQSSQVFYALKDRKWKAAMIEDMQDLDENGTWEILYLPINREA